MVLAPGVAALAGAGAVELWSLGRRRRWASWILPAAVAGTAILSAVMLGRATDYAPGLATVALILGAVGAAGLLAVLLVQPKAPPRGAPSRRRLWQVAAGAAAAISVVALLAGPFAYSASTISRAITGNTAAAGPAAAASGPSATSSGSDLTVDEGLVAYLDQNRGDAKYLVAVQATAESVPIILATGEPVVTIGGYKSRDPYPTVDELQNLTASGDLKYVLITSSSTAKGAGSSSDIVRETLQAVMDWVKANGTVIDPAAYGGASAGTLYYLGA